jgi:hypothetical protein
MGRPGPRGLAGAALAIVASAAVLASPSPLGEGPRPEPPPALACGGPACEPGADGLVDRIEDQLFLRMPGLAELPRRVLARTIVAEAEEARIDPLLVLALIQVESGWDPAARSGRGARGLMQLREATLRQELERSGLVSGDPHDPVTNVRAGVRYLRRLLDAFGREEVALMAYNAGPNRILGYMRAGEIPRRFHVYPRRVGVELRRLRRSVTAPPRPALANANTVRQAE